jgi:SAM-dependent methyltransferase
LNLKVVRRFVAIFERGVPLDADRIEWQLPPGITAEGWQYAQARFVAEEYDSHLMDHPLPALDAAIIARHLRVPGRVADLGCGTGRALLPLVRAGHEAIGIDLSQEMLRVVRRKAASLGQTVHTVRANLVQLECIADQSVDYAICLFSTLGMIQGAEHRATALRQMRRILRPGGRLVLHVHNYWFNLIDRSGRTWLLRDLIRRCRGAADAGDRRFDYHGIRNFYLHIFTRREVRTLLLRADLAVCEWVDIDPRGDRPLERGWGCRWLRAQGWIVVCEPRN